MFQDKNPRSYPRSYLESQKDVSNRWVFIPISLVVGALVTGLILGQMFKPIIEFILWRVLVK